MQESRDTNTNSIIKCVRCEKRVTSAEYFYSKCRHLCCIKCLYYYWTCKIPFDKCNDTSFPLNCPCRAGTLQITFEQAIKVLSTEKTQKVKRDTNIQNAVPSTETPETTDTTKATPSLNDLCSLHKKAKNEFYCKDCKLKICKSCSISEEHKYHKLIIITKYKETIKERIIPNLKFPSFSEFELYLDSNSSKWYTNLKLENEKKINDIKQQISALQSQILTINQESQCKIKKWESIVNWIRLLYKKYYADINELSKLKYTQIHYLQNIKYNFNSIESASTSLNVTKNTNMLIRSNIAVSFRKFPKFNKKYTVQKHNINYCSNMIKTKTHIGAMISLDAGDIFFSSGSIYWCDHTQDLSLNLLNIKQAKFKPISSNHSKSICCLIAWSQERIDSGAFDCTINIISIPTLSSTGIWTGHQAYITNLLQLGENTLCSSSNDGAIIVWDLSGMSCSKKIMTEHAVNALAYINIDKFTDYRYWISTNNKFINLWNVSQGFSKVTMSIPNILCVCNVDKDKRIICGTKDFAILILKTVTLNCESKWIGHKGSVYCIRELIDHRWISGGGDKTWRIWDRFQNICMNVLKDHTGSILVMSVWKDGRVVSGGKDATIRIWDREKNK